MKKKALSNKDVCRLWVTRQVNAESTRGGLFFDEGLIYWLNKQNLLASHAYNDENEHIILVGLLDRLKNSHCRDALLEAIRLYADCPCLYVFFPGPYYGQHRYNMDAYRSLLMSYVDLLARANQRKQYYITEIEETVDHANQYIDFFKLKHIPKLDVNALISERQRALAKKWLTIKAKRLEDAILLKNEYNTLNAFIIKHSDLIPMIKGMLESDTKVLADWLTDNFTEQIYGFEETLDVLRGKGEIKLKTIPKSKDFLVNLTEEICSYDWLAIISYIKNYALTHTVRTRWGNKHEVVFINSYKHSICLTVPYLLTWLLCLRLNVPTPHLGY